MFGASTLISSTLLLLASLRAVSAAELTLQTPPSLDQCHQAAFTVEGGDAPFDFEIFTSCADANDAPVAVFENIGERTVTWKDVSVAGGNWIFVVVTDVHGNEFVSKDIEVKGTNAASCLPSSSSSASSSATTTASGTSPSGSAPGTGSKSPGSPNAGAPAPNNAAKGPTGADTGSDGASASQQRNSASSTLASRPLEFAAGALALAALTLY